MLHPGPGPESLRGSRLRGTCRELLPTIDR
jgi:hypothetical protein